MGKQTFTSCCAFVILMCMLTCSSETNDNPCFRDENLTICEGGIQVAHENKSNIIISVCGGAYRGKIGIVNDKGFDLQTLNFPRPYTDSTSGSSAKFLAQYPAKNYIFFAKHKTCVEYVDRDQANIKQAIGCTNPIMVNDTEITEIMGLGIVGSFLFISSIEGLFEYSLDSGNFTKRLMGIQTKLIALNSSCLVVISETNISTIVYKEEDRTYKLASLSISTNGFYSNLWFALPVDENKRWLMSANGKNGTAWDIDSLKATCFNFSYAPTPTGFIYIEKFNGVMAYYNESANSTCFKLGFSTNSSDATTCPAVQPNPNPFELSIGEIVGIAIGVVVLVAIIIIVIVCVIKSKKNKENSNRYTGNREGNDDNTARATTLSPNHT